MQDRRDAEGRNLRRRREGAACAGARDRLAQEQRRRGQCALAPQAAGDPRPGSAAPAAEADCEPAGTAAGAGAGAGPAEHHQRWWRRWWWWRRSQHHDWRWLLIAVLLGLKEAGEYGGVRPMRWQMNSIPRMMSRFAAVAGFAVALWVASPASAAEINATAQQTAGLAGATNGVRARQAPSPLAALSRCLLVCVAHPHRRCELSRPVMLLVVRAVDPLFDRGRLLELLQSAPMPQR